MRQVLGSPVHGPAGTEQVEAFREHLRRSRIALDLVQGQTATGVTVVCATLLLPGGAALLMPAPFDCVGDDLEALVATGRESLRRLTRSGLHFIQMLPDASDRAHQALAERLGFARLTRLHYLERGAVFPWVDPPPADEVSWECYSEALHARFADVVAATYRESLDCPELTALRPIDDALASHKAAGEFDPRLWELAIIDGAPAGCVLLGRLGLRRLVELVYMGVAPEFRRRGVGALLLRRAIRQARRIDAGGLTLAVDERNTPALQLYARFSFERVSSREAYLLAAR